MKILNKFIWSKTEPKNKNDVWFDGSVFNLYRNDTWEAFTLPVDAAEKVAEVIKNVSEVYQEKLNAGYGIIIEGNTISVDPNLKNYDDTGIKKDISDLKTKDTEHGEELAKLSEEISDVVGGEEITYAKESASENGFYDRYGRFTEYSTYRAYKVHIASAEKIYLYSDGADSSIINVLDADGNFIKNIAEWKSINGYEITIEDGWCYVSISIPSENTSSASWKIYKRGIIEGIEENLKDLTQKNLASFTSLEYDGNLVISESVKGASVPTLPLSLSKGDKIMVRLTPSATALVARLKKDGVNVVTLVDDNNYQAGKEFVTIVEIEYDIDSLVLYSSSTIDVQVVSSLVAKGKLKNNDDVIVTPIVNKKGEDVLLTHLQGATRKGVSVSFYAPFQQGKKYRFIAKTDGVGISIYLRKNDVNVQAVADLPNMAATDHYEIDFLCKSDADSIRLWSYGIVEFTTYEIVETIEDLSGKRYVSQCVNNLIDSYDNIPLSAKQGVLLNEKVAEAKDIVNQLPSWESILEGKMVKFFHLDCGRKYFSPSNIKIMLDRMHENGFNTFVLHFSEDQGFRFKLDDMMLDVDGETYDLSLAIGRGISLGDKLIEQSDKYISEAEMDDIIAYAANYGIQVIPSFDMPSHMGAICKAFPQFAIDTRTINFNDGKAVKFMLAIIDKYAAYFKRKGSKIYNLGCDEISIDVSSGVARDNYFGFVNRAIDKIESYGMRAAMYNDYITADCGISKNVLVLYWTHSTYKDVDEIEKAGYKILNYSYDLYWALGRYKTVKYEGFDIWQAFQSKKIVNPLGSGWCCWCDNADHDGTDEGAAMLADTADIFIGVGNALNYQTKKIVTTLPSMTIGKGEIKSIDVEIPQGSYLDKVVTIEGINCNVVGYSNIDCKTDIRLNSLHDGTIRLTIVNLGESMSIAEGTQMTMLYL